MKTQLSKPSRTKARYTEEYKQEALELWRKSGRSAAKVAAELGIRAPLLYRWARPKRQAKLDIPNPNTASVGAQTINYDANGNRTAFAAYSSTDTYQINQLNQYISLNSAPITYTTNANLKTIGATTYTFDAQNRLTGATNSGVAETFVYDGLNRQVSRAV